MGRNTTRVARRLDVRLLAHVRHRHRGHLARGIPRRRVERDPAYSDVAGRLIRTSVSGDQSVPDEHVADSSLFEHDQDPARVEDRFSRNAGL